MLSLRAGDGRLRQQHDAWRSARSPSAPTRRRTGPRQLMLPEQRRRPAGRWRCRRPSAVSYRMIAPAKPPLAEPTMTASEVAMNSALPRPQPARKPTIPSMLSRTSGQRGEDHDERQAGDQRALGADPARHPAGDEHRDRGDDQVAGEQQLDLARAWRRAWPASDGRIGSTRPMPMNEMTQANATAQTALGCWNGLGGAPWRLRCDLDRCRWCRGRCGTSRSARSSAGSAAIRAGTVGEHALVAVPSRSTQGARAQVAPFGAARPAAGLGDPARAWPDRRSGRRPVRPGRVGQPVDQRRSCRAGSALRGWRRSEMRSGPAAGRAVSRVDSAAVENPPRSACRRHQVREAGRGTARAMLDVGQPHVIYISYLYNLPICM